MEDNGGGGGGGGGGLDVVHPNCLPLVNNTNTNNYNEDEKALGEEEDVVNIIKGEKVNNGKSKSPVAVRGGGGGGGSIAVRRAATFGFKGSGLIDTAARSRCISGGSPPLPPPPSSPCITIPSGISPTALLLDSPIILTPNSQPLMDFEFPIDFPKAVAEDCTTEASIDADDRMCQHGESIHDGDQIGTYPPAGVVRTSEDGYKWRKYGQKYLKRSEFPRSYYKCTHPNCRVRKKLESTDDGQITEIVYKGVHNHPKPRLNRPSFLYNGASDTGEDRVVWRNIEPGLKGVKLGGLETSTSAVTDISDPGAKSTDKMATSLGSREDDDEVVDESKSHRRKKDVSLIKTKLASRRERRVVVEMESEADMIDDGYRWRKYGQKKVKGSPNPRSYYRCTNSGCLVKKHIERSCHNSRCVITTYEGKHNHEVPTANIGHLNLGGGGGGALSPAASSTQPPPTLPGNINPPKSEPQDEDHFKKLPDEFVRSNSLGNFEDDVKLATAPVYQLNYPPLESYMPYASSMPDFPMLPLPLNIPLSASVGSGGFSFTCHGKHIGSVQYFYGEQRLGENETRLIEPKQEPRDDESLYDAPMHIADHMNASSSSASSSSSSSSVYFKTKGSFSS